jgi:HAD superfamily hydrolase (TIGR01509 family)
MTVPGLPAAVLWDMDGTLVDTEPYWIDAEFEIVEMHGGTWSHDHAKALVGSDLLDSGAYIREHGGVDRTPTEIVEMLLDRVVARVRAEVPWRPGARELLAEVRGASVHTALVTMSWRRFADEVVNCLPTGSFTTSVTGDEVARGKPRPEPYLRAAERLGVRADQCLAIEDSPTGVRSALAAGCRVIAVPHVVEVSPDLADLPESIGQLTLLPTLDGVELGDLVRILHRMGR